MNKAFDEKAFFFSDSGIYPGSISMRISGRKRAQWTTRLLSLLALLTSAKVRTAWKVGTVALCLVGMIGLIGGMEAGVLPLPAGLLLGAGLIGIEFLCLRRK